MECSGPGAVSQRNIVVDLSSVFLSHYSLLQAVRFCSTNFIMNAVSPFCLAILLCSLGVFANMKDFRETKCFETIGITEEEWKKHEAEPNPEIDEKIGCLHACIMKRTNTMSEDNVIDVAAVEKLLEDADDLPDGAIPYAKENMARCAEEAQKLEGECEIAKHFVTCTFNPELQSSAAEK